MTRRRVYFIRPIGMTGPIKIGCSASPTGRKQSLAMWSPLPLEIVAEIDGDEALESRFHQRFITQHKAHEWFFWSRDLQETIDAIVAGTFDASTLPEANGKPIWKGKGKGRRWSDDQRLQQHYSHRIRRLQQQCGFMFRHNTYRIVCDGLIAEADKYLAAPHIYGEPCSAHWALDARRKWLAETEVAA